MQTTAFDKLTYDAKLKLLAEHLISEPWVLVSVGLGNIPAGELARHLLNLAPKSK